MSVTDIIRKRKWTVIAALILITGLIRGPIEDGMLKDYRKSGFLPAYTTISMADQVGSQASIAMLGGLRFLIATYVQLDAWTKWQDGKWEDLMERYQLVTILQPRDSESWIEYGWHLAYNASAWMLDDRQDLTPTERKILSKEYIDRGIAVLEEGLLWCPEDPWLYRDLGQAYVNKTTGEDRFCKAADVFLRGSKLPNAPGFLYRFYAYNLAKCEGSEAEAYKICKEIYDQGREVLIQQKVVIWKPTLIKTINTLEEQLRIPPDKRIPEYLDNDTQRIVSPLLKKRPIDATIP